MSRRLRVGAVVAAAVTTACVTLVVADASPARADTRSVRLVTPGTTAEAWPAFGGAAGEAVFFSTGEPLTPDDHNGDSDVYRRTGDSLTLMTGGIPGGGVEFLSVSQDGTALLLETGAALVAADTNGSLDIYRLVGGRYALMSDGSRQGKPSFLASSPDAGTVAYELGAEFYTSDGGTVRLVHGSLFAEWGGADTALTRIFFRTGAALVPQDTNTTYDVYAATPGAGSATLVSDGIGENDYYAGNSADGRVGFAYSLDDHPDLQDADGQPDVLRRDGTGPLTLLSVGDQAAQFAGTSADGRYGFFTTAAPLTSDDQGINVDIYRRDDDGALMLMSGNHGAPIARYVAPDGSAIVYTDPGRYPEDGDTDYADDVFRSTGPGSAHRQLLSGTGPAEIEYLATSTTGRVFFRSPDRLLATDTDAVADIYVHENGSLTQVSAGNAEISAEYEGASPDGSAAYYETKEQVTADDHDITFDLYQSLSTGPDAPTTPTTGSNPATPTTTPTPVVGTGPPPMPEADTTPPEATVEARRRQPVGGLRVRVRCGAVEPCAVSSDGRLDVTTPGPPRRQRFLLAASPAALGPGQHQTLVFQLPRDVRRAALSALQESGSARARLVVTAADRAGNLRRLSVRVTLTAPRR